MRFFGAAIIGCGYWGANHVRIFNSLSECKRLVVCDPNFDRLAHMRSRYPSVECVLDVSDIVADPQIEAVVIATPPPTHYEIAKACMLAGKHVLVEKPMTTSTAEAEELIDIARREGVVLMAGHTYLYSGPVRRIAELIDCGEIGLIRYINARRLNLGIFQDDTNVAWDLAPHDLAIILHFLGEMPRLVNCQGNAHVTPGVEDVTNLSLTFGGGRFATIQSSWLEPRKIREMTIVGTRKMIVYNDVEPLEKVRIYDARVDRPPHYDTFADFVYSYHYGDCFIPRISQEEPLLTECRHFVECIMEGATPLSDGNDGLKVAQILEAADRSLRAGGAPTRVNSNGRLSTVNETPELLLA